MRVQGGRSQLSGNKSFQIQLFIEERGSLTSPL